jgi:hypothetical protein
MSVASPAPCCSRYPLAGHQPPASVPGTTARRRPWILGGSGPSHGKGLVRARRAPDRVARRAVVRSAWMGVVDGSAEAVGERVARVVVEPAGL